jgi:protein-L-isoaspartate O-methyltransferase
MSLALPFAITRFGFSTQLPQSKTTDNSPLHKGLVPRFGQAFPDHIKESDSDCVPTPPSLAQAMIQQAEIKSNMKVLEPSAGTGNIATELRKINGIQLEVGEFNPELQNLLRSQGFNVVSSDFLALTNKQYDRILMNPPFSRSQAAIHVQHAYDLLKPGGKLVAVIPSYWFSGRTAKNRTFVEWLKAISKADGTVAKQSNHREAFVNEESTTAVETHMLTITKPKKPTQISDDLRITAERQALDSPTDRRHSKRRLDIAA